MFERVHKERKRSNRSRPPLAAAVLLGGIVLLACSSGTQAHNATSGSPALISTSATTTTAGTAGTAGTATTAATGTTAGTATTAATTTTAVTGTTAIAKTTTASTSTAAPVEWTSRCGRAGAGPKHYDHVIWIWMENKNTAAILGSAQAPFLHELAAECGSASDFVDNGVHPSLPNYLEATSGGTQGVSDDRLPTAHPLTADNIFRQVRKAGGTAKSYEESMPSNCSVDSTAKYAAKHNPAAYYVGGDDRTACAQDDVPFTQFVVDLNSKLPSFAFITPDICNDMHSCPVKTGDDWLRNVVGAITASPTYRAGSTAVFVVFDESDGAGTMPFYAVAPSIAPGTLADQRLDHSALLAFTEDALGVVDHLGHPQGTADLAAAFGL